MTSIQPVPQSPYRLPEDVKPVHYDVLIKTDLEHLTFEGFVNITLDIKKETSKLVFNSHQLEIHDVTLTAPTLQEGEAVKAETVEVGEKTERATATFATSLPSNSSAQLRIRFTSKLQGTMLGYYFSNYKVDGVEKHYALTQFEPTFARRCFPCWDEPLLKATFNITMVSKKETTNLSNMPVVSEVDYDLKNITDPKVVDLLKRANLKVNGTENWKLTTFQTTPAMSTYLVALANGPFEYIEGSYTSPISGKVRPLRVYATSDVIGQAQYGLDVKAKVLPVYEKLFDVEFPLPKLDTLIAHDFDSGAMENWGLITGRTSIYCLDPNNTTLRSKIFLASVQSHEVAHQWFGNIVTMAWWDNLWLNEGFATIMGEMIALDKIESDWDVYSRFITDHVNQALRLDGKRSSHPVEVPLENPDDINQVFDDLSYCKAGSVLRMLSEYVGEANFLKGVSIYLKKRLYGSSVTVDLWDGISEATGLDIPALMNNWILKIGYPVVSITENSNGIKICQNRFLETGDPATHENETIWTIPLFITTQGADGQASLNRHVVLSERESSFDVDSSKPYLVNGGKRGLYRVLYPQDTLDKIAENAMKPNSFITQEDRMALIGDSSALAQAGYAKASSVLSLAHKMKTSKEFLVCQSLAGSVNGIGQLFWESPDIFDRVRAFSQTLFMHHVERLGYETQPGDAPEVIEMRTLVIGQAAGAGVTSVVDELNRRFRKFIESKDLSHIPADLISAAFRTATRTGGIKEWDAVAEIYRQPPSPLIKQISMSALGATRDPALIDKTLELAKTEVPDGDLGSIWASLASNRCSRRKLADFMMQNWEYVDKRFEGNYSHLQRLVKSAFELLSTEKDAETVERFFDNKDTSKFTMSLAQALETIRTRSSYRERCKDDVEQWLTAWESSSRA